MYGLKTIRQINAENEEAQRIMEKHNGASPQPQAAVNGTPRMTAAERTEAAQATMKRILNGARS